MVKQSPYLQLYPIIIANEFWVLRVLNDVVAQVWVLGHPHRDMEIISIPLEEI